MTNYTVNAVKVPFDIDNLGDIDGLDVIKKKLKEHNIKLFETYIYVKNIITHCCSTRGMYWCKFTRQWSYDGEDLVDKILTEEQEETLFLAICHSNSEDDNYYEKSYIKELKTEEIKTYKPKERKELQEEYKDKDLEQLLLDDCYEWNVMGNWIF